MTSTAVAKCAVVSLALAALTGCALPPPQFSAPGPAVYQQKRAQLFDPYPENDVGPPVVGGRPQSYENPIAEPSRARWDLWWFTRRAIRPY
jgi:hypothetical protein